MTMVELLLAPFTVCLVLTGIHCYLGIHVVKRGVIFVDLALAQVAALGSVLALLAGYDLHTTQAYWFSLIFTLAGAGLFALGRFRDGRIPQEAFIGIVYVLGSALAILVLDRAPHGHEAIEQMLVGSILYVTWPQVLKVALIYGLLGLVHYIWRKPFLLISTAPKAAEQKGMKVIFWDFLFYATFGLVVTSSVRIAGVLLVFAYLVIPAASAMLLIDNLKYRLLMGWGLGILASVGGLFLSAAADLPTGASVVAIFGLLFVIVLALRQAVKPGNT